MNTAIPSPLGGEGQGEGALRAAGTLPRPPEIENPSTSRRVRLVVEIVVLFVGAPLLMMYAVHGYRVPVWAALFPVLVGLLVYLLWDKSFSLKRELSQGVTRDALLSILVVLLVAGGMVTAYVAQEMPDKFLSLPRDRPGVWRKVLTNYPFLSVLVQEFVYRTLFFHRYGPLFGRWRLGLVLASGVLFGFGHIIFQNWVAVAATTIGGIFLSWRYAETRSFWAVWIEHTLWGWLIFTVGLGGFFFTGIATGWRFSL